jgi:hypothetical protein
VTPADAYFGRDRQIHAQRAAIKKQTIEHRALATPQARALTKSPTLQTRALDGSPFEPRQKSAPNMFRRADIYFDVTAPPTLRQESFDDGHFWCGSSEPETRGERPIDYCVDDRALRTQRHHANISENRDDRSQ